ncbi:MAG: HipA family kinase [Galactobacter sp.]
MSSFPPLSGFDRPTAEVSATTVIRSDISTGCSPLFVRASDGCNYWIKPRNNPHGLESLVAERVVAAVGKWLGAPVVPSTLVDVPDAVAAGVTYSEAGLPLVTGVAHGSKNVATADESTVLGHHLDDGNRDRIPAFIALWEFCAGTDEQWIYDTAADCQIWSFDHGLWVGGQGEWHLPDLQGCSSPGGDVDFENLKGLIGSDFEQLAQRIESFNEVNATRAVASVPVSWGVPDDHLMYLAHWLFDSRSATAAKLRNYAGKCSNGRRRRRQ